MQYQLKLRPSANARRSSAEIAWERVTEEIGRIAGTDAGRPLFKTRQEGEWLWLITSYRAAGRVLPAVCAAAVKFGLFVYDGERQRPLDAGEAFDRGFAAARLRAQELNAVIRESVKPLWKLRQLEDRSDSRCSFLSFAVTLRKDQSRTLRERTEEFYTCLQGQLAEGEKLCTDHRCFAVEGPGYCVTYCLEAYKKTGDRVGFVEDGAARTDFLGRMSCETAFRWIEAHGDPHHEVMDRMKFEEMVRAWPNPADRFVRSVNIAKELKKEKFGIRYAGSGYYGSEILFYPWEPCGEMDSASVLKIEEETAGFLLPAIYEVYPYFSRRYYLTLNLIPFEMMEDIVKRLKEMREIILHDTRNEALLPWIKQFNLFVLADPEEYDALFYGDKVEYVYRHRYEIAHLYDMFTDWVEAQLNCWWSDDLMFGIKGP